MKLKKAEVKYADPLAILFAQLKNLEQVPRCVQPKCSPSQATKVKDWNAEGEGIRAKAERAGVITEAESKLLKSALGAWPSIDCKDTRHTINRIVNVLFLIKKHHGEKLQGFERAQYQQYDFLQPAPRTSKKSVWKNNKRHNRSTHGKGAFA